MKKGNYLQFFLPCELTEMDRYDIEKATNEFLKNTCNKYGINFSGFMLWGDMADVIGYLDEPLKDEEENN